MFSKRLKKLRKEKKLTQREFAELMNLSSASIAMYETDKRSPDRETIVKMAKFFDVSTDYLLGESYVRHQHDVLAFSTTEDLTEEEIDEVRKYIEFLRTKRDD